MPFLLSRRLGATAFSLSCLLCSPMASAQAQPPFIPPAMPPAALVQPAEVKPAQPPQAAPQAKANKAKKKGKVKKTRQAGGKKKPSSP